MSTKASTPHPRYGSTRTLRLVICGLLLVATVLALWATADREWEQTWKDRTRVETPLGSEKSYVLSWVGRNVEFHPFVDTVCQDALKDIPIVMLAGIDNAAVASFARILVRRNDILAGKWDHMSVFYFFDADDKVVGHYYLPFHELASFEKSHQLLVSR